MSKFVFSMMQSGCLYGRRIYEIMRYWDDDQRGWDAGDHDFAATWRAQPKWVVSRTPKSVGPNATRVGDNVEASVRRLDECRLYFRPLVLGRGKPYFAGARGRHSASLPAIAWARTRFG